MKLQPFIKLIIAIIISQSAGLIGTLFTFSAIPTWYKLLDKPSFAPPNWVFGPVWTTLYTLIGISLFLIWQNKKKPSTKLFFVHLFLNAIWSPIFFGLKDLGLAFAVILLMDITLIVIIKYFYKFSKLAAYLLIPYLLWISFASVLNFSIWQLNNKFDVYAQEFNFNKSREDYIFNDDNYKKALYDFNLKKGSYDKNKTLSLKEEFRGSAFQFVSARNNLLKSYLTMLRMKTFESQGIDNTEKERIFSLLDTEISWYSNRKNSYDQNDKLEDIINKTKEEDSRYETDTKLAIYYTLTNNSLGDVIDIKNKHISIYEKLKNEAQNLISLGRADSSLFDRWFNDINNELDKVKTKEIDSKSEINKILGNDTYLRNGAYQKSIDKISETKVNLLMINRYVFELENTIASKR